MKLRWAQTGQEYLNYVFLLKAFSCRGKVCLCITVAHKRLIKVNELMVLDVYDYLFSNYYKEIQQQQQEEQSINVPLYAVPEELPTIVNNPSYGKI